MFALLALGGAGTVIFLNADDGASWIQCIWSVVGVFTALIFPGYQAQVEENASYNRRRKLLTSIVAEADQKILQAAAIGKDDTAARAFVRQVGLASWQSVRDSLDAFPVEGLRGATEVTDLMMVRRVMAEAADAILRAQTGSMAPVSVIEIIHRERDRADGAFVRLTCD